MENSGLFFVSTFEVIKLFVIKLKYKASEQWIVPHRHRQRYRLLESMECLMWSLEHRVKKCYTHLQHFDDCLDCLTKYGSQSFSIL